MTARKKNEPESDASGVPAWMVTFSDCMTLLLCFFVLLLTFSSFDEVDRDRLGGAFPGVSFQSISTQKRTVRDAVIPPRETEVDHTREGSERPTDTPPRETENPKTLNRAFDAGAYRNRKVVSIPSHRLFFAQGSSITPAGKRLLKSVAAFIRVLPCRTIVGERRNPAGRVSIERAAAVVLYLTETERLAETQFSLSADTEASGGETGRPVVEIVLMAGGMY